MNIVLAHNYYGSSAPSGENSVFEAEAQLLRQRGHNVIEMIRHSDEIREQKTWGSIRGAFSTPWNPFSKRAIERLISQLEPDILHVHNSFPLLSPSVFYAARKSTTAVILTLHNFRIYCAAGALMRGENLCTDCLDKRTVLPALYHRCYRGSLAATIPMATMIWLHRLLKTWELQVDAFIAPTEIQRDILCSSGLTHDRVFVKPHFYPNPPNQLPWDDRDPKVLFIGRLNSEKGCSTLLESWRLWGPEAPSLEVIGDGPERSNLEAFVEKSALNNNVTFKGQLPFQDVQERLKKARLLAIPSHCSEAFGMVIIEAYALGVPVAGSRVGAIRCLIKEGITGTLFEAGNPQDLLDKVKTAWTNPLRLSEWSASARKEFEQNFTAEANYHILMKIYEKAIEYKKNKFPVKTVREASHWK